MRLIDADKVNETIDRFIGYLDEDMIYRIKMKISKIPTVERPHGEWIPKAVHNCWTRFECSVCGYYHEPVHDFGESKPDFNFCPNCGAKMEAGDSE